MNFEFWRRAPRLRKSDVAWTLVPAMLWAIALYSRGVILTPHCAEKPELCTAATLPPMDRPAIGLEAGQADSLSFTTQGLSGVIALTVPPLWHLTQLGLGALTPAGALLAIGTDLVILTQTTVINGLLTETSHLLSRRPRPFVYADPQRARDYSNYTSFYSGHTSFAATATVSTTLMLTGRGAPTPLVLASAAGAYALASLTGTYRVLAGRHFPTDVLIGALMGAVVAIWVARRHRQSD